VSVTFIFEGGPDETDTVCTVFGLAFPVGVPVEVTDPRAIAKLRHNSRFRAEHHHAAPHADELDELTKAELTTRLLAAGAKFDRADNKATLLAQLRAL
jgi:hypothetical protein